MSFKIVFLLFFILSLFILIRDFSNFRQKAYAEMIRKKTFLPFRQVNLHRIEFLRFFIDLLIFNLMFAVLQKSTISYYTFWNPSAIGVVWVSLLSYCFNLFLIYKDYREKKTFADDYNYILFLKHCKPVPPLILNTDGGLLLWLYRMIQHTPNTESVPKSSIEISVIASREGKSWKGALLKKEYFFEADVELIQDKSEYIFSLRYAFYNEDKEFLHQLKAQGLTGIEYCNHVVLGYLNASHAQGNVAQLNNYVKQRAQEYINR